jgi:hypothetical protein
VTRLTRSSTFESKFDKSRLDCSELMRMIQTVPFDRELESRMFCIVEMVQYGRRV